MRNVLFYIVGAATVGVFFTLWCAVAVQRVRKESEASKYGELCARIQKQIDETRMRISFCENAASYSRPCSGSGIAPVEV